jgi:hypothetical protein
MSICNTIVRRAKAFATKMLQGPVARDVEVSSGGALSVPMAPRSLALARRLQFDEARQAAPIERQ